MNNNFLPFVSSVQIDAAKQTGDDYVLYELLTTPLHEELYRRNTFDFVDELNAGQRLALTYDYVQMQVGQGGFIQLIQNGYVGLLPDIVLQLQAMGAADMAATIDSALQIYVLNNERLDAPTTVQEFAKLYDEYKEVTPLDEAFMQGNTATIHLIVQYAIAHLHEFVQTD
jgi:hypothetical protein